MCRGAVIYLPDTSPLLIAQNIGLGTNNRAELCAIWAILRANPWCRTELKIYSDSEYAIGSVSKDWTPKANVELIQNIRLDLKIREQVNDESLVSFEHVDGHNGVEGNEIADKLANIGRKIVKTVTLYEG